MALVTTATAANLLPQRWTDVDVNTNEEMVHANKIKDLGMVNKQLNVPLMASIAAATLSAGSGNNLSFTANTEGVATFTPATRYAAVELEKQAAVRAADDLKSKYKMNLQMSLAAIIDSDCLAVLCPVPGCGGHALRQVAGPRSQLDGISGHFPGASAAWEARRESHMKKERKSMTNHGEYLNGTSSE